MSEPPAAPEHGRPPRDDVGPSLSWAWDELRRRPLTWIPLSIVLTVLGGAVYFAVYVPLASHVTDGAVNALGFYRTPSEQEPTLSEALAPFKLLPLSFGLMFVLTAVLGPLASNLTRLGLAVADGRSVSPTDLLRFPRGVVPTWTLGLLLALGSTVGMIFCYVPGLVFAALSCFSYHLFYDRGLSPLEAVKASFSLVRQHVGISIVALMLTTIILVAGTIACLVGTVVTAPLAQLFMVHRYRAISGGSVVPHPATS